MTYYLKSKGYVLMESIIDSLIVKSKKLVVNFICHFVQLKEEAFVFLCAVLIFFFSVFVGLG